ncbi:hypothetical protein LINGRAHAP2_LOCUS30514 [Linum grandiflorum]
MASRFVLNTNNLWLIAVADRTIAVTDPGGDLNTHNLPSTIKQWHEVARVGSNSTSTHRELEVFGKVFSGRSLEQLSTEIINHQLFVNREGFMVMYFNQGHKSLLRRLNDLFDWSKYGVNVPIPVETMWDRFYLNTGKLMVDNKSDGNKLEELSKLLEEKEKENLKLKEQLDGQDEQRISLAELLKDKDGLIQRQNKDLEERDKELSVIKKAVHDKEEEIAELKSKLAASNSTGGNSDELEKLRNDVAAKDRQINALKVSMKALIN